MKTEQIGSEIEPPEEDDTLALIASCPKCDTQRAFKVNDSFMLTITRKSSGCRWITYCSICGYELSVLLAWTQRHPGWLTERLTFKKAVCVEDHFGMNPAKGKKEI